MTFLSWWDIVQKNNKISVFWLGVVQTALFLYSQGKFLEDKSSTGPFSECWWNTYHLILYLILLIVAP